MGVCQSLCRKKEESTEVQWHSLEGIHPATEDDLQQQGRTEVPEEIIPPSENDLQRQGLKEVPQEIIPASENDLQDETVITSGSEGDESYTNTGASAAEQDRGQNTLGGNTSTGQNIKETDKVSAMLASKTDKKSALSSSETETITTMPALEKDATSPMSALQKVYQVLVDCLDPDPVLDKLLEIGFPLTTIRDIREERFTSDRNRKLIEAVRKRGYKAYCNFKSSLVQCRQELLYTLLERTEKGENTLDLQREIREKTREKTKPETKDEKLYKGRENG